MDYLLRISFFLLISTLGCSPTSQIQPSNMDYKNVGNHVKAVSEKGIVRVVVKTVNYNNYDWNYWGYRYDWLQAELIQDLNSDSYTNVQFYSDSDARAQNIRADKIIEITFPIIRIGNLHTNERLQYRTTDIPTGTTTSNPPKTIYTTVRANVTITQRHIESNADLQCRIFDSVTGSNIFLERFSKNSHWLNETATYLGDQRALDPEDGWRIDNGIYPPPERNAIAQQLIRDCYTQLLARIRKKVNFNK